MSPNVGNFVHDLVEMAKAMETLPQVQAELSRVRANNDILSDTVADREIAIARYKDMIEALNAKVRATEAERDDAEMRFLELDEKAHKVLVEANVVKDALAMIQFTLDPPKPQPEPIVDPMGYPHVGPGYDEPKTADVGPGPSEVPPTAGETTAATPQASVNQSQGASMQSLPDWKQDQVETSTLPPTQPPISQGQGEVNPTADTVNGQSLAVDQASVSSNPNVEPKPSGPYANKRYYQQPLYISRSEWLAGGGTEDDYDWRPSVEVSPS